MIDDEIAVELLSGKYDDLTAAEFAAKFPRGLSSEDTRAIAEAIEATGDTALLNRFLRFVSDR